MRLITKVVDSKSSQNASSYSYTKKSYSITKSASSKFVPSSLPSTPSGSWPPRSFLPLQKSQSTTEIIATRGFKPSDVNDPSKKAFLNNLTKRVFKVGLVSKVVLFLTNVCLRIYLSNPNYLVLTQLINLMARSVQLLP